VFFILVVDLLKASPIFSPWAHYCHSDDKDDVLQRRCNFTGHENNDFLFFFQDTRRAYKNKLFKSYCSSIYGNELWSFED